MLHRGRGWPIVVVRPFNAYGPAQSPDRIIPEIIVKALRSERLAMTEGRQTREFNYVEDLVDGFLRAATVPGVEGEVFNIGGGEEISMRDLATTILDLMGDPIVAEFGALPARPTEIWSMRSRRRPRPRTSRASRRSDRWARDSSRPSPGTAGSWSSLARCSRREAARYRWLPGAGRAPRSPPSDPIAGVAGGSGQPTPGRAGPPRTADAGRAGRPGLRRLPGPLGGGVVAASGRPTPPR